MTHSNSGYSPPTGNQRGATLIWVGGALGIGACIIGLALLLLACFGMNAALALSPLPVVMGSVGLILSVIGGISKASNTIENSQVLAAIVVPIWGILGGLVLMAAWLGWTVFAK